MEKSSIRRSVIIGIVVFVIAIQSVVPVNAMTVFESDGIYHEEGYIFVGESHSGMAAHAFGTKPEVLGNDISFAYQWDWSQAVTESGDANTFIMKGNLFFIFEGIAGADGSRQADSRYIYSSGTGERGRAVEKIHEIINTNPNIAHWNIISMHGAASAKRGTKEIADYYVDSYHNWIAYEFPQADCYFLSVATMTKYYKNTRDKKVFNNTLAEAFPDRFFDYTDFYASRSPQRMIDTVHWDEDTYIDLILDVIGKIAQRKQKTQNVQTEVASQNMQVTAETVYSVADVQAVLYTNDTTVIYSQPAFESAVVLPSCEAGIPIQVTGITGNGFFRVCVSADRTDCFIAGNGLSQQP